MLEPTNSNGTGPVTMVKLIKYPGAKGNGIKLNMIFRKLEGGFD